MSLTDHFEKYLQARGKPVKLTDTDDQYLYATPRGLKSEIMAFRLPFKASVLL
jgi:hypothetical protein